MFIACSLNKILFLSQKGLLKTWELSSSLHKEEVLSQNCTGLSTITAVLFLTSCQCDWVRADEDGSWKLYKLFIKTIRDHFYRSGNPVISQRRSQASSLFNFHFHSRGWFILATDTLLNKSYVENTDYKINMLELLMAQNVL
jgi:hypothetical protein